MRALLAALLILVVLLVLLAPTGRPRLTSLEIDATGTASAAPDQLVATLAAQASGHDPASVQGRVNAVSGKAVADARTAHGVQARLLGYDMSRDDKGVWTASSNLRLVSTDPDALLALLGQLQSAGLILDGLNWQLSPGLRTRERAEATRAALRELRARVNAAAAALRLDVDHLAEVRVSDGGLAPRPLGVMRSFSAPAAPSGDIDVTVNASAIATLRP